MIVDEKGLCRVIKQAYKTGGYTVMEEDGNIMVWAEEWFVQTEARKLPKKVLGLLVEHLGTLPGAPTVLQKNADPQLELAEVAAQDVAFWHGVGEGARLRPADVILAGWQVMQNIATNECWAVEPDCLNIVDAATWRLRAGLLTNKKIMYMEDGELVAVSAARPAEDAIGWIGAAWKKIEEVTLCNTM